MKRAISPIPWTQQTDVSQSRTALHFRFWTRAGWQWGRYPTWPHHLPRLLNKVLQNKFIKWSAFLPLYMTSPRSHKDGSCSDPKIVWTPPAPSQGKKQKSRLHSAQSLFRMFLRAASSSVQGMCVHLRDGVTHVIRISRATFAHNMIHPQRNSQLKKKRNS